MRRGARDVVSVCTFVRRNVSLYLGISSDPLAIFFLPSPIPISVMPVGYVPGYARTLLLLSTNM